MGQKRDLQLLMEDWPDLLEVRLASAPGIFHSKLILVKGRRGHVAFIGSANATMAAFERNEEIMLRLEDKFPPAIDYFENAWSGAVELADLKSIKVRTLVDFYRSGSLFFKASRQAQFTFNPFTDLISGMKPSERRRLEQIRVVFGDPASEIGPFNILKAIDLEEGSEPRESVERVGIARIAVETCYGYWVHYDDVKHVRKRIDRGGSKREAAIRQVGIKLEGTLPKVILSRYKRYLDSVRRGLVRHGFDLDVLAKRPGGRVLRDAQYTQFWRFYDRLRRNLENGSWVKRYASPLFEGSVPEIWDDPIASLEFEASFFESLSYISGRPRRTNAAKKILDFAGINGPTPRERIQERVQQKLRRVGWQLNVEPVKE